jgi:peptidoglycan hydrolase-like protein with peptidoglycan-binding domain
MKIELTKPFARNSKVEEYDVRQIKKALNRLGYYVPLESTGITGIPDAAIFQALKTFQQDQNLPATGKAKPGDETTLALNRAAAKTPDGSYIWRTVEDDKVRSSHVQYNRQIREWADAPDPGEEFNCRCWAEPYDARIEEIYDPPLEPVYPEVLLIPMLRAGKLYNLWKAWQSKRGTNWTLGTHKSDIKWGNQLKNRNWTHQQITETIQKGNAYKAPNNVNQGNTATRYEYQSRFVVRDDQTKEILQISGPGKFKPME